MLNEDAVFTAARGFVYTAPEDTEAPTPGEISSFNSDSDNTLAVDWVTVGHTARDELPEFGYDGGDTENLGTWQSEILRTVVTDPYVDYVTFSLHQFDDEGLELYYGKNNASATSGVFHVDDSNYQATRRALLVVIMDGAARVGFYAPKCDIRRDDSIGLGTDALGVLPLRATFLRSETNGLFSWISEDTGIDQS